MTSSKLLSIDMCTDDPNPFDDFDTVGLAELNSLAALQTRVDRKYLLPSSDLNRLIGGLRATARALEIDGRRSSEYTSTYFDTEAFDSYFAAARSRPNRFKVRVRTYVDTDAHYLEVKTRSRARHTTKTRCPAVAQDHLDLSTSGRTFVLETLADKLPTRAGLDRIASVPALRPALSTHYQRTTLLIEPVVGSGTVPVASRATIDTSLTFSAPGHVRSSHPSLVIVETKTAGAPSPVDRLLWRSGHRPTKVSKFGVGVALLHGGIPANKWNRVLQRDFAWEPLTPIGA